MIEEQRQIEKFMKEWLWDKPWLDDFLASTKCFKWTWKWDKRKWTRIR